MEPLTVVPENSVTSAEGFAMSKRELLTVPEFCKEWKVARSTFYAWLAKGEAPRVFKLPNGQIRIDRRDIEAWEAAHELGAVA